MAKVTGQGESQLSPTADKALDYVVAEFRDVLSSRAAYQADGPSVTASDVDRAYKELVPVDPASMALATSRQIVARALFEDLVFGWVSFAVAIANCVVGLSLLYFATVSADSNARLKYLASGSTIQALVLIPFRFAMNCRRHIFSLRTLQILLDRVKDRKKLDAVLMDAYVLLVTGHARQRPSS